MYLCLHLYILYFCRIAGICHDICDMHLPPQKQLALPRLLTLACNLHRAFFWRKISFSVFITIPREIIRMPCGVRRNCWHLPRDEMRALSWPSIRYRVTKVKHCWHLFCTQWVYTILLQVSKGQGRVHLKDLWIFRNTCVFVHCFTRICATYDRQDTRHARTPYHLYISLGGCDTRVLFKFG